VEMSGDVKDDNKALSPELQAHLDAFLKSEKKQELGDLLQVLGNAAAMGTSSVQWPSLKKLISVQLENVMDEFIATSAKPPPIDGETYETRFKRVQTLLNNFPRAPFTLQRICELLVQPKRFYKNANKYFLAFSKLVCGISGREIQVEEDPLFPNPFFPMDLSEEAAAERAAAAAAATAAGGGANSNATSPFAFGLSSGVGSVLHPSSLHAGPVPKDTLELMNTKAGGGGASTLPLRPGSPPLESTVFPGGGSASGSGAAGAPAQRAGPPSPKRNSGAAAAGAGPAAGGAAAGSEKPKAEAPKTEGGGAAPGKKDAMEL